jgi:hypothetical protein
VSPASSSGAVGPEERASRSGAVGPEEASSEGARGWDERRFELPPGLTPEEERAIIRALERYFVRESPHPNPWVLAGRIAAAGLGALQARHYTDDPWRVGTYAPFARRGIPPMHGRGDAN